MTKRPPIDLNSTSIPRITAVIAANPGIRSKQIAAVACYALSHTKNILSILSRDGVAKPVPIGYDRGWFLAELATPLLQQWERTRRRRDLPKSTLPTKRDKIEEMSRGPSGVSMAQIMAACHVEMNAGGKHCLMMVRQGRIYRASREGCRIRWFDIPERAKEWAELPAMEPSEWSEPRRKAWESSPRKAKPEKRAKAPSVAAKRIPIAKPAKPAPVFIKAPKEIHGPPFVDYSRAKVTLCQSPTHHLLYQVDPATRVIGGFASAGIGRYEVAV